MSLRIALGLVAVLAGAPAAAAAEHNATVGLAAPTASWAGGPGLGVFALRTAPDDLACSPIDYCDSTLIHITDVGDLSLHAAAADTPAGETAIVDLDVYAYVSDASGTQGDELARSESESNDEAITITELDPGYVLFVVNYALGAGSYDGDVLWTPPPPPEGDPKF